jgi:hypothetical protein
VEVHDLGVNPLSVIFLVLKPLNETATLSNYARYLSICESLNQVRVLYRGASVVSMTGRDLAVLNYCRHNIEPREANPDNLDNSRRNVVLPILLGRFAYDPNSCFPKVSRGDLTLELDIDVADTGYDGYRYCVETCEILNATPREYERKISINRTFPATGANDVPLPIGNLIRGFQMFGTTGSRTATPVPSWGNFSLLRDNQQDSIANMEFGASFAQSAVLGRQPPMLGFHQHTMEPVAGIETTQQFETGAGGYENYSYVDLDPTRSDLYSVNTAGANSLIMRVNALTADAVRITPVERVVV